MAEREQHVGEGFKNNELVWGKVPGYPWWPGQICSDQTHPEKHFRVDFFGYPSTKAVLPENKIIKYEKFDKNKQTARISPSLKRAINEAVLLFSALEESKHSFSSSLDPHTENTLSAFNGHEDKLWLAEPYHLQTENSCPKTKSAIDDQQVGGNTRNDQESVQKRQKKKKIPTKDVKAATQAYTQDDIEHLLESYGLNRIPVPVSQAEDLEQQARIVRRFYKIFRRQFAKETSRVLATEISRKIMKAGQWKEELKQLREGPADESLRDPNVNESESRLG